MRDEKPELAFRPNPALATRSRAVFGPLWGSGQFDVVAASLPRQMAA